MAVNLLANLSWYLQFGSIRPLISLLAVGVLTVLSCSMCSAGISHHSEAEVAKNHLQLHTAVLPGYLWHSEAICVPHHLLWRLPEAVPTPAFPPISLFRCEPHWAQQDFPCLSIESTKQRQKSKALARKKTVDKVPFFLCRWQKTRGCPAFHFLPPSRTVSSLWDLTQTGSSHSFAQCHSGSHSRYNPWLCSIICP